MRSLILAALLLTLASYRVEWRKSDRGDTWRCAEVTPAGGFVRWLGLRECETDHNGPGHIY